ncbi:MAG: EAL domain-containing protein [Sulfurimonadaceae bacterium]|jgi:diguanylate cyclase (GGDEF)-like protein|nr:EAL domain-containing protein [Sulfurimonadaceae bacterium]
MLQKMNFYTFLNKQIIMMIVLSLLTAPAYILMGWFYGESILYESIWFSAMVLASLWGYKIYESYKKNIFSTVQKERWAKQVNMFFSLYFFLWNLIFIIYVFKNNIHLHYIAIGTQIGTSVVAATLLASQKTLARVTIISLMVPLVIYFLAVGEYFSYLLAFFSIILFSIILYASSNTYKYISHNEYQAYHDHLTSLGNRRYLTEYLQEQMKNERNFSKKFYMLLIDLDHFKTINDTLGHDVGDMLLCEVAKRIDVYCQKSHNKAFRIGGDEFCVISAPCEEDKKCLKQATAFAHDLLEIVKESYIVDGHSMYISASIGVSLINNQNIQINTFIKEADIAMYEAKSKGRDGLIIFNDALSKRIERRLDIERLLHFAIANNEIYLNYQPQVDTKSKLIGCEVLVRWKSEKLGFVPPDEFITISEQTGIIIELGYYILEEAFKTLKIWSESGIELEQFSINISMRQLFYTKFLDDVKYLIEKHLNPSLAKKILFEITETSVSEDMQKLRKNMEVLKSYGIRFSMDDFGTGYSSLSYLRQIPLYELKIDKSFIAEIANTKQSSLVKTILSIAKNLKLKTVAEGVEESFQKDFLIENECDVLQGYYFSKPLSKEDFEKFHSTLS